MSMTLWIILLVAAAAGLYVIMAFNRLVRARQMANEAWSGIDVQLKRRSDLIPNLVDSVKGYAAHERSVLEEVTQLRGAARALPADDVASRAQAEGALSGALGKLFAVAENYPDLKASSNFLDLQKQLSDLENELQMARRYYNGTVRNFNTLVQSFPSSLIAGMCGFGERAFFEVSDAADRAAPQVTLAPAQSPP
jgi:LemA protein